MSLTIDRLQRAGYVLRERSTADRRRVDLLLTPSGVRIKKQQKVLEPKLVAAVLARLDERKRRQALRGLELLAEASREMIDSGDLNRLMKRGAA
jgi:DNA-binding MarR family transcriptional regulator